MVSMFSGAVAGRVSGVGFCRCCLGSLLFSKGLFLLLAYDVRTPGYKSVLSQRFILQFEVQGIVFLVRLGVSS